jgi:hypothetical protein
VPIFLGAWCVPGVWARAGVAIVVALAAACVSVPGAQAISPNVEVAYQLTNGHLFTSAAGDTGLGMMAGTSPSVDPVAIGSLPINKHQVAFQANTGNLWVIGPQSPGDGGLGMAAGTSPSIDSFNAAFQANTGNLYVIGPNAPSNGADLGIVMMPGTSPTINRNGDFAAQDSDGDLELSSGITTFASMMAGTSPNINENGQIAFQGSNGNLWTGNGVPRAGPVAFSDTGLGMKAGTSPSINDNGDTAFQGSNGHLWLTGSFGTDDLQLTMMPGTSPSMDDDDDIVFQGANGDVWDWIPGFPTGAGHDTHTQMMAGTSPSISRDPGLGGPPAPTSKDRCQHGLWRLFGFKTKGDCVSFVATGGKNPPSGS